MEDGSLNRQWHCGLIRRRLERALEAWAGWLQGSLSRNEISPDPAGLPTKILQALAADCVVWATVLIYNRRYLRSFKRGSGGLVRSIGCSIVCGCPFPFIASIFFNRRSSNVAKSCSLTWATTLRRGTSWGKAATAHLILTGNGMDGFL